MTSSGRTASAAWDVQHRLEPASPVRGEAERAGDDLRAQARLPPIPEHLDRGGHRGPGEIDDGLLDDRWETRPAGSIWSSGSRTGAGNPGPLISAADPGRSLDARRGATMVGVMPSTESQHRSVGSGPRVIPSSASFSLLSSARVTTSISRVVKNEISRVAG